LGAPFLSVRQIVRYFHKYLHKKTKDHNEESKLQPCIERNNQRVGKAKIPATAIAATSNKLQLPGYDEGFDELYFVKNDGRIMTIESWRD
jgi:hypothetical protein